MTPPRKYATEEERKEARRARWRARYRTDPEFRKRHIAESTKSHAKRCREDPAFRKRFNAKIREDQRRRWRDDPAFKQRKGEGNRRWRMRHPDRAEAIQARSRAKRNRRIACETLVNAATESRGDPESLFHDTKFIEGIVGVTCPRLRKVARGE